VAELEESRRKYGDLAILRAESEERLRREIANLQERGEQRARESEERVTVELDRVREEWDKLKRENEQVLPLFPFF
jgi:hypothetical protein